MLDHLVPRILDAIDSADFEPGIFQKVLGFVVHESLGRRATEGHDAVHDRGDFALVELGCFANGGGSTDPELDVTPNQGSIGVEKGLEGR